MGRIAGQKNIAGPVGLSQLHPAFPFRMPVDVADTHTIEMLIQQSLKVQPDLLLGMVREAIGSLPVFNQAAHLILNPADAALVRERIGEQLSHSGWKLLEDARMEQGGARLETANSQIDASLEARWKRVTAAMGQENSWLVQE